MWGGGCQNRVCVRAFLIKQSVQNKIKKEKSTPAVHACVHDLLARPSSYIANVWGRCFLLKSVKQTKKKNSKVVKGKKPIQANLQYIQLSFQVLHYSCNRMQRCINADWCTVASSKLFSSLIHTCGPTCSVFNSLVNNNKSLTELPRGRSVVPPAGMESILSWITTVLFFFFKAHKQR